MDPENNIEEVVDAFDDAGDEVSVDDFIRQLEAKEKDLHITAETSIIEIAESFIVDGEVPEALKPTIETSMPVPPPPARTVAPEPSNVKELNSEIANLKAAVKKMEKDRDEMFENSQRRTKDFESFKARSERERKETFQSQISNVAMMMLPALDNLQRALDSAEDLPGEKNDAFQQFYDGIVLVSDQINDILNKMGIKPIRTIGEEFDPHYHEAVAMETTDEFPPNHVCAEILRGYIAGERVIRHSMVKVAVAADGSAEGMPTQPTPPSTEPAPRMETFPAVDTDIDSDSDLDSDLFSDNPSID